MASTIGIGRREGGGTWSHRCFEGVTLSLIPTTLRESLFSSAGMFSCVFCSSGIWGSWRRSVGKNIVAALLPVHTRPSCAVELNRFFPPAPPRPRVSKLKAWEAHNRFLGQASNSRAGNGGHHLSRKSQDAVLTRLMRRRRSRRRVLEAGYGTGYMALGLAALGADVFGIELRENSGTIRSIMKEANHVVLCDLDAHHLSAAFLDRGRFTSLTCIIGMQDITLHVAKIFLQSHYCTELAYLLPSRGAKGVRTLLERGNVSLEQIPVTLAGSGGRRSIVVAIKRERLSFA